MSGQIRRRAFIKSIAAAMVFAAELCRVDTKLPTVEAEPEPTSVWCSYRFRIDDGGKVSLLDMDSMA